MPSTEEIAHWLTRDAVAALPEGALQARLATGRTLTVKLGLDPTAPDVHLGHTVVLRKLREFQDLGHRVVLVVGDYTARVGDPSGRSTTRPQLTAAQIDEGARTYEAQALKVLDPDPDRLQVRRNGEWLDMAMEDLFALARTTTVAQVLERDDFAQRQAAGAPISILELLYPLLQGYDSVAVRADIELGGTDQRFNLLLARDIQRAYGVPEQVALIMPILTGTDGHRKMSKSLGNHIGVLDSPAEVYGKTLSIPDSALTEWWPLLIGAPPPAGAGPREAKRELARRLVAWLADERAAARAQREFDRVHVEHAAPEEIEELSFRGDGDGADGAWVHLPALIAEAFAESRSQARRLLAQGAVRLNGEPLDGAEQDVAADRLDGAILQVGRRRFRRLRRIGA